MQKLLVPIFLIVSGAFFIFISPSGAGATPVSTFGAISCFAGIISGWIIILVSAIKWLVKESSGSSDKAEASLKLKTLIHRIKVMTGGLAARPS